MSLYAHISALSPACFALLIFVSRFVHRFVKLDISVYWMRMLCRSFIRLIPVLVVCYLTAR